MKVCRTCRYWSDKHKGLCTLVQRGTGQFWMCDAWLGLPDDANTPQEKENQESRTG